MESGGRESGGRESGHVDLDTEVRKCHYLHIKHTSIMNKKLYRKTWL